MEVFNQLTTAFEFLTKEFGFECIHQEKSNLYLGAYLVIYRNIRSGVQLEFSADETWFHCVIRRLVHDKPASYSDKMNCIGFEDLAALESNTNYAHFDYVVTGKGLQVVLNNTASLLKRQQRILTTDSWVDVAYIQSLRDEEFFKNFGIRPSKTKQLTFFDEIRKIAHHILITKGFILIIDSNEQPPYSRHSRPQQLVYNKANTTVKIKQEDWRDAYWIYYLAVNDEKYAEVDLSNSNNAIQEMTDQLIKVTSKI